MDESIFQRKTLLFISKAPWFYTAVKAVRIALLSKAATRKKRTMGRAILQFNRNNSAYGRNESSGLTRVD